MDKSPRKKPEFSRDAKIFGTVIAFIGSIFVRGEGMHKFLEMVWLIAATVFDLFRSIFTGLAKLLRK